MRVGISPATSTRPRCSPGCGPAADARRRPVRRGHHFRAYVVPAILIIGAGPIVIGQACEFDYSGTQACKALREEGYRVILVNSNPATIMTDPELADATYIEPITPEVVEKIIEKERPDALLPTMGGQTALNCALALHENGVLEKYGVELIGATIEAIDKAEDRELFKDAMTEIGLDAPRSRIATRWTRRCARVAPRSAPAIIRPSFTMGGTGGGIAYNREEFSRSSSAASTPRRPRGADRGIVLGWKEFEMEVVRDKATTASSSARSRTSTRWACTPATRSPSRRR
jgi:carbamoyl-phosphate synthase large subunit